MLVGLFSFRTDFALVPDLLSNLAPIVDAIIYHDDRGNEAVWYHEGKVRNALIRRARELGAEWVLCVDPDERFERGAHEQIRRLVSENRKAVYGFNLRELWHPDYYRIDGVWGEKRQYRLFPLADGQQFDCLPLHSAWAPRNCDYELIDTEINLYHLKMIDPSARAARRDLYKTIDSDAKYQLIGYDYLTDEKSLQLERVPAGREYIPHVLPVPRTAPDPAPDPEERQNVLGKWEWWYQNREPFPYGETCSYEKAAAFLNGHGLVEDWGCGMGWARRFFSEYRGVDGSPGGADIVADLREYVSDVPCILLRHVLEHNHEWRTVLQNAMRSFSQRMVIILFTPYSGKTKPLATHWSGIPDYSFCREDLFAELRDVEVREETFGSKTVYGVETILYISDKRSPERKTGPLVDTAPQLLALSPASTDAGRPFNVQNDGTSAISVNGRGFTVRSVLKANNRILRTTFGDPTWLTGLVPADLFNAAGIVEFVVQNQNGCSSNIFPFEVRIPSER